ncbi:MAG: type II toxin-antitoxin system VapB family antitoxin [Candidatus Marinimicrobia bacterium]|nr:type II toxin-antitoxin system VapB family antitoxin [Candidatus Neomarinimicrobiota bacterium]
MIKTTVVLDEELVERAKKAIGVKTKKAAIEAGLKELIKSEARNNLRKMIGKDVVEMTPEELERIRENE